jgi:tetratricopeptide (TPR) repeat protein
VECLARANDLGFLSYQSWANVFLGWIKATQGQYAEARAYGELALSLDRDGDLVGYDCYALWLLGAVAIALDEREAAQGWLEKGVALARGHRVPESLPNHLLGITALRRGQPSQARRYCFDALREVTKTRNVTELITVLPTMALYVANRNEVERAVELYALASRYPFIANSRWSEEVVGEPIAAMAATLPPDILTAAQERGRARDLWATADALLNELEDAADKHDSN